MTNMDGKEQKEPKKTRLACFDLIRVFACLCVVIIHFNAKISAGFLYKTQLIPNHYFDGHVYLGDIGVCLFFMLSGATQMLTYREGNLLGYYKKRFLNLFPLFWMAYLIATILDFLTYKSINLSNPPLFFYSLAGLDGYLCTRGFIGFDFYKLGEWFLGCILLLYAIFPILYAGVKKRPILTVAIALAIYVFFEVKTNIGDYTVNKVTFYLRIPEILFGMLFVKHKLWEGKKPFWLLLGSISVFVLLWFVRGNVSGLTMAIGFCCVLFSILVLLSKLISAKIGRVLSAVAGITYAVFLVHHWLIAKMVSGFNLETISRKETVIMFIAYLIIASFLAYLLKKYGDKITGAVLNFFPDKAIKVLAVLAFLSVIILPVNAAINYVRNAHADVLNVEAREALPSGEETAEDDLNDLPASEQQDWMLLKVRESSGYQHLDMCNDTLLEDGVTTIAVTGESCRLEGWAIDPLATQTAGEVFVQVADSHYPAEYGKERQTVADFFGNSAYMNSGYTVTIDAEEARQSGEIAIHVISADGCYRYAPVTFTVNPGD